jgi:hypothetical protein
MPRHAAEAHRRMPVRAAGCSQRPSSKSATLPSQYEADMTARDPWPMQYRLHIRGHLDPVWTEWFAELAVTQKDDGTTQLVGQFSDQSALYGLLARLRDLGATLLMVAQLPASGAEPVAPDASSWTPVSDGGAAPRH